jgi:hypothetical protein
MVQPVQEKAWQCLKKLEIQLLYDPASPFLGIYPKELKTDSKGYQYTHTHSSTSHNSQKLEAIRVSTDR